MTPESIRPGIPSVSDSVWLQEENTRLQAENARLKALLTVAKCPECDGSGGRQISDDEAVQCRWCYERSLELARLLAIVEGKP